jgi:hypothetical protein
MKENQQCSALANMEQTVYKIARTANDPIFIDHQGVMYHGSEFIAAGRG